MGGDLLQKVSEAEIPIKLADAVSKADQLVKGSVFPAAEAGFALAKEKISEGAVANGVALAKERMTSIDIGAAVADATAVSKLAMANSLVAADGALTLAKDHISGVDVPAGVADVMEKSREVMAGVGPAAGMVSTYRHSCISGVSRQVP